MTRLLDVTFSRAVFRRSRQTRVDIFVLVANILFRTFDLESIFLELSGTSSVQHALTTTSLSPRWAHDEINSCTIAYDRRYLTAVILMKCGITWQTRIALGIALFGKQIS